MDKKLEIFSEQESNSNQYFLFCMIQSLSSMFFQIATPLSKHYRYTQIYRHLTKQLHDIAVMFLMSPLVLYLN